MIELDEDQDQPAEESVLEVYRYDNQVIIILTGNGVELGNVLEPAEALELSDALARAALTPFDEEKYQTTVH